jgi:hypothetical protein
LVFFVSVFFLLVVAGVGCRCGGGGGGGGGGRGGIGIPQLMTDLINAACPLSVG